jgi:Peptidase C39 family
VILGLAAREVSDEFTKPECDNCVAENWDLRGSFVDSLNRGNQSIPLVRENLVDLYTFGSAGDSMGEQTAANRNLCGPKCLHFILTRAGRKVDLSTLVSRAGIQSGGTTFASLARAAVTFGLQPWLLQVTIVEMQRLLEISQTPLIISVDGNHFVCVIRAWADSVEIFDPNKGLATCDIAYLENAWDKRILAFEGHLFDNRRAAR